MTDLNKLIKDNVNLVYYILHRHFPNHVNDEDAVQVGRIGIWNAAMKYDNKRSKWEPFLYTVILNELRRYFRTMNAAREIPSNMIDSLDDSAFIDNHKDNAKCTKLDRIGYIDHNYSYVLLKDAIDSLTSEEHDVLYLYMNRYTQTQIGQILNYSQSTISRLTKSIKLKLCAHIL